jgi:hypothetical protein
MMPLSLMPSADEDVLVERSQPVPVGIKSCKRYVCVPS